MIDMIWGIYILLSLYLCGIVWLTIRKKIQIIKNEVSEFLSITIIVPLRNEEQHIQRLYDELNSQKYNLKYEVVFVDDHSDDATLVLLKTLPASQRFEHTILELKNLHVTGKKAAIRKAVEHSASEWIITTDADTIRNENWLSTIALHFKDNDLLILPLSFTKEKNILSIIEIAENHFLQALTQASFLKNRPILCNGANLAVRRLAWIDYNDNNKNGKYASGDDMFLLDAFIQFGKKISFISDRDAAVTTSPSENFTSFIHQKLRWNSKNSAYQSPRFLFFGFWMFSGFIAIWLSFILSITGIISFYTFLTITAIKCLFEIIFITVYNQKWLTPQPIVLTFLVLLIYPFLLLFLLILNMFIKPRWKGRAIH